jgi:hypothetical protein
MNKKKPSKKPSKKQPKKAPKKQPKQKSSVKKKTTKSKSPQPPFQGAVGAWVKRRDFEGRKSFGIFMCHRCKRKTWRSAYAMKKFRQGCKKCNKQLLPKFMWENSATRENREKNMQKKGPHDSRRCEACRLGVCDSI